MIEIKIRIEEMGSVVGVGVSTNAIGTAVESEVAEKIVCAIRSHAVERGAGIISDEIKISEVGRG
jgi:hypothetical protein